MKDNGHGAWSPYLAGGLSGVLLVVSVALKGEFFGASTSFVRLAGMLEEVFLPERVSQMPYFLKTLPKVEWQVMFVLGILLGSFLAAMVSGSLEPRTVPPMWAERFGASRLRRGSVAFVGGVVIMIGARLAGGCPTGHGLSGLVQLSLSGYIALLCFFAGGILTARLLYRQEG